MNSEQLSAHGAGNHPGAADANNKLLALTKPTSRAVRGYLIFDI
jgi:hypothetical protein